MARQLRPSLAWAGRTLVCRRLRWPSACRMIFGRLKTIDPFEDLVDDPRDRAILMQVEGETNERLRLQAGGTRLAASLDLDPKGGLINAPLAHARAIRGRFAGAGGHVGYFADGFDTALAEVVHHQGRRARANRDLAHPITMRVLSFLDFDAQILDLRGLREDLADIHDPDDYGPSVALANAARAALDPDGIAYDSVRRHDGQNLALFRRRYTAYRDAGFVQLDWDGERIRGTARLS
ncbi:RES family NAD+ phosphorylase [Marinivivus vitaminiproducens]|uniref:RES family NAD+ phosphorylase n=1 Tax=Marinivivus vitaminiproducens TaxID=3035935 RepID=UPI00279906A8|nr:RES family NAD+ phosphorylase [Geminicoccaceae bacterium SCSIO 64248]